MKYGNSLIIFIYILLADLFLYFVASLYPTNLFGIYADLAFSVIFSLSLFGFFLSSFTQQSRESRFYYYFLWVVSLIYIYLYIFQPGSLLKIARYYFVLAVLIALLLAILDYKRHSSRRFTQERELRLKDQQKYTGILNYQQKNLNELREYSSTLKEMNEEYQIRNEQKNHEIGEAQRELMILRREAELITEQIRNGQLSMEELDRKTLQLKEKTLKIEEVRRKLAHIERQNLLLRKQLGNKMAELREKGILRQKYIQTLKRVADSKKDAKQLEQENLKLKRTIGRVTSHSEKQEELKQKYSKTLRNIQKDKQELESLLVVSPDGKSVHRPNCIVVRNISKEDRKLIPSWKEARKLNYKGCKLCSPNKNNESVVKGTVKYRFVGGKSSDKIHRLSCVLVNRIAPHERQYFRTYKQAVKNGYTPCRVCNPTR